MRKLLAMLIVVTASLCAQAQVASPSNYGSGRNDIDRLDIDKFIVNVVPDDVRQGSAPRNHTPEGDRLSNQQSQQQTVNVQTRAETNSPFVDATKHPCATDNCIKIIGKYHKEAVQIPRICGDGTFNIQWLNEPEEWNLVIAVNGQLVLKEVSFEQYQSVSVLD